MRILILLLVLLPFSSKALDSVSLQLKWKHQFQFAGFYAAKKLGYYKDVGLEVEIREASPTQSVVEEVHSGRATFGVSMADVIVEAERGKSVAIVAPIYQHSPYVLVSRKDICTDQLESLRGKRVMVRTHGADEIRAMLTSVGVDTLNSTITPHSWNCDDLANGIVDASTFYTSDLPQFLAKHDSIAFHIYSPINYGIDFYGDCIITNKSLFKKNPKQVEAFREASLKGWEYALSYPMDIISIIQSEYDVTLNTDILLTEAEEVRKLILPKFIEIGHSSNSRWSEISNTFMTLNMLPEDYTFDSTIVFSELTEATLPRWVVDVLLALAFILILLLLFNYGLKRQVQKQVEDLRRSEGMFHTFFDTSNQLLAILTIDGKVHTVNRTALNLIDVTLDSVVGVPFYQTPWWRHSTYQQQELREGIQRVARGNVIQFDATHLDSDGMTHIIDFSLTPVVNRQGKAEYIIAVGYNMTHIHEIEERDRQLQKMEAIGTLAGGIAHDFNNILAAIFGYLNLAALEEQNNENLSEAHEEIRKASTRAKELVGQILTFSRKGSVERKPLQLSEVVSEAMKLLRSSIPSTITIDQRVNCDDYVLANSTQIHQVVMNLCTNAYHAMESQNSGLLSVSLDITEATEDLIEENPVLQMGEYLELKISDTGAGMNHEIAEQIFNPYFTTKVSGKGTGLGLSLVHSIISSHDGLITVASKAGIGTTFTILLPVIEHVAPQNSSSQIDLIVPKYSDIHIMFVDDEAMIVKSTTRFLEHEGFVVSSFTDSSEALEAFEEHPERYSVVVTDMTMPLLDGVELINAVHKISPLIPAIICSGFNQHEEELREEMPGINQFLQKPISMPLLIQEVRKCVSIEVYTEKKSE